MVRTLPYNDEKYRQDVHCMYYQAEKVLDTNLAYMRWGVNSL